MARAIDATDEEGPLRTCIVTRARRDPAEMIRFVLDPAGRVTPDIGRKLPGRGVWVTATNDAVAAAVRGKAFPRAFKGAAEVSASLPGDVEALLEADALRWFSLANKAGLVTAGFAKVEAALAKGGVVALIHASDAGADGVEKLGRAARRALAAGATPPKRVDLFGSAQLDLALGRPHVIHAALMAGPAAGGLLARCERLALFRGLVRPDPAANESFSVGNTSAPGAASMHQTNGQGPGIANE